MFKYSQSELMLIWVDSFIGLEYKHKSNLFTKLNGNSDLKKFIFDNKDYICQEVGESKYNTIYSSANQEYLNFVLEGLEKRDIKVCTIASKNYPERLKTIECPPLVLYTKGNLDILSQEMFSIVGSRKSLPLSISLAKEYSQALSNCNLILVTGIAEGVDTTVLQTCLDNGKLAVSVITGGFDNIYPKTNMDLIEKVAQNGLVISEFPPETVPKPYMFPIRNRIIAGLSKGVLIVSAGEKSGTLYTAEYAEQFSRDLFAIPYSPGIRLGVATNDLIKRGAMLTDSPKDILEFYNLEQQEDAQPLSQEQKDIIKILSDGQKHIENICQQLKKQTFELIPILSELEIKGLVVKMGNIYGLIHSISEE